MRLAPLYKSSSVKLAWLCSLILTVCLIIKLLHIHSDSDSPPLIYNVNPVIQNANIEALISNQKNSLSKPLLTRQKFVYVMKNQAGYGNKMYAVLTGFTLALVTNSNLIINWPHINKYVQEPFYKCFLTKDSHFGKLSDQALRRRAFHLPPLSKNTYKANKSFKDLIMDVPTWFYKKFVVTGGSGIFFELACNRKNFQTFLNHGLVSVKAIKAAELSLGNLHLQNSNETVHSLYRVGFELAHNFFKLFWKPIKPVEDSVNLYYDTYFKQGYVIGMQLRFYYLKWSDVFIYFECALEIEKRINKTVLWFISTDSEENLIRIRDLYPSRVIHANGTIGHVEFQNEGYSRAMLDNQLLSRCDELIITGGSTFGFIASIKSNHYPLFVNGGLNVTKCERFSLVNPSFTSNHDTVF